jgi:zinc transport system substrate-binding protein
VWSDSATIFVTLACLGCPGSGVLPDDPDATALLEATVIRIEAANYPLEYLAERIGGERVEVSVRVPVGIDPALWSPDAADIGAFQDADLVLLNGAGYEGWIDRVSLLPETVVDTSSGFRERYITIESAVTHSHGSEGSHSHGDTAFTTWIDPLLAIEQARAIRDAMVATRPAHATEFERGLAALEADLRAIDERLEVVFERYRGEPLLASHPVYQYLARRYGLEVVSVRFEPDEAPDDKQWRELRDLMAANRASWMLWEAEPLNPTAQRLAALGVGVIVFDPCAGSPPAGDFLTVMQDNLERVESTLGTGGPVR